MDAVVTEDQRMVLDTSVRFIEDVYPLAKVRAGAYADEAPADGVPAGDGCARLVLDAGAGRRSAAGASPTTACSTPSLIAAKRGAGLQPGPFVGTNVVAYALANGRHRPAPRGGAPAARQW